MSEDGGSTRGVEARRGPGRWLGQALDFVVPPACLVCGRHCPRPDGAPRPESHRIVCAGCASRVRPVPAPRCRRCRAPVVPGASISADRTVCRECRDWPDALSLVASATLLGPPATELVHGLKYGGWPQVARVMARAMKPLYDARPQELARAPLVPVPTTANRERRRGYNQSRVLALALAERCRAQVLDGLVRTSGETSQVALHRSERRANVRGVFSPRLDAVTTLRHRGVILVDDVLTTGATASEVAEVLAGSGVTDLMVITFARALPEESAGNADPRPGLPSRWLQALRSRSSERAAAAPDRHPSSSSEQRS